MLIGLSSGGVYVDLDFDAYKPLTPVFQEYATGKSQIAFVGRGNPPREVLDSSGEDIRGFIEHSIPNAFMASTPGHLFWTKPLQYAKDTWYNSSEKLNNGQRIQTHVESVVGPACLYRSLNAYNAMKNDTDPVVIQLPPEFIYPFMWYETSTDGERMLCMVQAKEAFDLPATRRRYNDGVAYGATYWAATWK